MPILRLNRPGGPLGIRAEHLHRWLHKATREEEPDAANWRKVVAIAQEEFRDGPMVDDINWSTVVLITKGLSGDFKGIGLVEVLWKTFTSLLNR